LGEGPTRRRRRRRRRHFHVEKNGKRKHGRD